ncbi:glycosyltransferase family 2 protein [Saccharopolyspora sp. NFXS83]|uniref:glycosyltransferase family 2 protein n=1 Tax=Saccharopolyspora sp. NFXS83 TaxID=2993560 RepID=UPI00224AEDDF|nr:glycosyltransferase family 2 protein [Saccharopolyspora sp. NFXS83]MCX2729997.1 glycosyltransferase family 2 protein [Saccharopolyspora sp. NFXS83]
MIPWWVLAIAVFGANFTLWGLIGLLRVLDGWHGSLRTRMRPRKAEVTDLQAHREKKAQPGRHRLRRATNLELTDVAVLIAAHNEELVIRESLRAITALIPLKQVHVVSDGSSDRTVEFARRAGVNVISTEENVGKAGALQVGIRRFRLVRRYRLVMLLDADTRVEPGYFTAALPLFDDPDVVAVAGCVRTSWRDRSLSFAGRLVAFHRQRIYSMTQYLLKFGQTWRHINATHIVPGFASLYRTDVLPNIEVNPPGLVIEDFNMTFEVYQKRLGKVGFTPSAVAATQDPGTLRDYVRQSRRWSLGLWQTVRRHPPKPNLFTAMLSLLLLELLTSSIMLVLLPLVLLVLLIPELAAGALAVPWFAGTYEAVSGYLTIPALLLGIVLPDLLLTCVVTLIQRQPRFLLYAWLFLPLRVLDSAIALSSLPLAWWSRSNGRWSSPRRHSIDPEAESPGLDTRVG